MKIQRLLVCFLLCLTLCLSLACCNNGTNVNVESTQSDTDNTELGDSVSSVDNSVTKVEDEIDSHPPEASVYQISYVSNGDGTCYVDAIKINMEQSEPFVLEVPEKSPDGDTVTAIRCQPFANLIPQILTEEEYKRLDELMKQKYEAGEITHRERYLLEYVYNRRNIEFVLCGKSNPETVDKPFVYVYNNHVMEGCVITDVPDTDITNVLVDLAGYTPQTMLDGYDTIREMINTMETSNRDAMLSTLSDYTVPDNLGIYISEIKLPNSVGEISAEFYSSCRLIKNVDLPDSITRVTIGMFYEMTSLESVSIPEGVTHIDYSAFIGCSGLKRLEIPNSIEVIDPNAFSVNAPIMGTLYKNGYYLGNPDNPYLVLYKVPENTVSLTTHPNTKLIYDDAFYKTEKLRTVTLNEGIVKTDSYLFGYCKSLSDITLPDSLTKIGHGTFSGCENLKTVRIPETVSYIGYNTFSECKELTEIELPKGIDIIYQMTFRKCTKLKSVNIPENVTEIHIQAFQYCESLESIVIPKNVHVIDSEAFDDSGLKELYYGGTESDWANIEFGENAIPDGVTVHFYSETHPDSAGNYWHYVDGIPVAW